MSEFQAYFIFGYEHILTFAAFDHILFLMALCAIYKINQWKQVLILITAFTIGHSITLFLSVKNIFTLPSNQTEFYIALTILITAFYNILPKKNSSIKIKFNYLMALGFGLIHGLGFSNQLKSLFSGDEILMPLFGFNIGIEAGQILIVLCILVLSFIIFNIFKAKQRDWKLFLSGGAAFVALQMMIDRIFW